MYPHKNFKAHKACKCHCTRHTGLYRKWLWHMGWIKAPHKQWVQQSKSVWLALLSAEHLQGAGRHLSTPKANRGSQLTPGTPLGSHLLCRRKRHGFLCLLPQLVVVHFFHVLETTCWRVQHWGRLVVNTATVSFLMRVGCMERGMQVLKVKEEEKIVQRRKKKAAVCVGSKRCGWWDRLLCSGQCVFPKSSCQGPP